LNKKKRGGEISQIRLFKPELKKTSHTTLTLNLLYKF